MKKYILEYTANAIIENCNKCRFKTIEFDCDFCVPADLTIKNANEKPDWCPLQLKETPGIDPTIAHEFLSALEDITHNWAARSPSDDRKATLKACTDFGRITELIKSFKEEVVV